MRVLAQVGAAEALDFARGRHQIDVRLVVSPRAGADFFSSSNVLPALACALLHEHNACTCHVFGVAVVSHYQPRDARRGG